MHIRIILMLVLIFSLTGCDNQPANSPHGGTDKGKIIYHSSYNEQPKTLDPARSYNENEAIFTAQIYEPPLQYAWLVRPYTLIPLTAVNMPEVQYFDAQGKELKPDTASDRIAHTIYTIKIQPGIYYQPHPAFAKNAEGKFLYHHLSGSDVSDIDTITDFPNTGTRELTALDYAYEVKRLADPKVQSPVFGLMSQYIYGMSDLNKLLQKKEKDNPYVNLNNVDFEGVTVRDRYTWQIKIKGNYPQFIYWLAMPFFAPIPWEADAFYSQPVLQEKNITLDWYPIGTGPYMLLQNNPNRQIIMVKNPNFHKEFYPGTNERLPFIDEYQFSLEKESIPRWTKFIQGYYDASGISSDNFDQAITVDSLGNAILTPELEKKHLNLDTVVSPSIFYLGFNMLDPVVGGNSESARKLRQAISIAVNFEEFISIFLNGQGVLAQGPIPPEIFGFSKSMYDPWVYNKIHGRIQRKSIQEAKKLLAEAGYPNGINAKTGEPLILYFDAPGEIGPDSSAMYAWMRKQFAKVGIQLDIRATQYNRFQEKMRTGNAQIFMWGWSADYPDPENFLFLLYGPNSKALFGGENPANYQNPEYDRLFVQMKSLPNGEARQKIIDQMVAMVQRDSPWVFGYFPRAFRLSQQWVSNSIPNAVANNTLKYIKLNPKLRKEKLREWNQPKLWPIIIVLLAMFAVLIPFFLKYHQKIHKQTKKKE